MNDLIHENFLLLNKTGQRLYHEAAESLPIVDYHNHLKPKNLAENKVHDNIARMWVVADQYKHRAMRIHGIPEHDITGKAEDRQKFDQWMETFPYTAGNPLFHWSLMEMKKIFGIDIPLTPKNAGRIWNICNERICNGHLGEMDVLSEYRVQTLCTSDDLLEDIGLHEKASGNGFGIEVKPSLRGDSILKIDRKDFTGWLNQLSGMTKGSIKNFDDYLEAVRKRLDVFGRKKCVISDHGLDAGFEFTDPERVNPAGIFDKRLQGRLPDPDELAGIQSFLLLFLCREYTRRGWIMQLHIGAQRYTSTRLRKLAGSKGGFACIGESTDAANLCYMLDSLEKNNALPDIILFNLNPSDNEMYATLTGSFTQDGVPGKIQFGPAWWYNDHFTGIQNHLTTLAGHGLLSHFIGMTTDSRSVLSFSRHEYFRRVLCDLLGEWVEKGLLPRDTKWLGNMVRNISYENSNKRINKPES